MLCHAACEVAVWSLQCRGLGIPRFVQSPAPVASPASPASVAAHQSGKGCKAISCSSFKNERNLFISGQNSRQLPVISRSPSKFTCSVQAAKLQTINTNPRIRVL